MRSKRRFACIPNLPFENAGKNKRDVVRGPFPSLEWARGLSRRVVVAIELVALAVGMSAASAMIATPAAVPAQVFQTSAGPVEITPIYHASAMIKAGGDTIYIDPARPGNISGLRPANLILITDIHRDHMDTAYIAALSDRNTEIIAPAAVQETVTGAKVLGNGESMQWHNWRITAVPMYNIHHLMPNGQPYHPKGRGNGYVLSYGGKNFYFAGDTEGTAEMSALRDIDVAFVPMNLPFTMSPEEAAAAVRAFKPKIAIPYHYRGQDLQKFAGALRGSGIEVRLLDWYSDVAPGAQVSHAPPAKVPSSNP
jgi:L-ascorbate metabolism protein UlaG (beta-lactamase superfamily)